MKRKMRTAHIVVTIATITAAGDVCRYYYQRRMELTGDLYGRDGIENWSFSVLA
jgi:hypothetical protein